MERLRRLAAERKAGLTAVAAERQRRGLPAAPTSQVQPASGLTPFMQRIVAERVRRGLPARPAFPGQPDSPPAAGGLALLAEAARGFQSSAETGGGAVAAGVGRVPGVRNIPGFEETVERQQRLRAAGANPVEAIREGFRQVAVEGQFPSTRIPLTPAVTGRETPTFKVGVAGGLEVAGDITNVIGLGAPSALRRIPGAIARTARPTNLGGPLTAPVRQAARETPEAIVRAPGEGLITPGQAIPEQAAVQPPAQPPTPPRGPDVPPTGATPESQSAQLLPDLTDFDTQLRVTFETTPETGGGLARRVGELPGVRRVAGVGDPSLVADTPVKRAGIARAALRDEGKQRVSTAMSFPGEIGTQADIFGSTNLETGLFQTGKLVGRSANEVAENPSRFADILSPNEIEWFDRVNAVDQAATDVMRRSGIDIKDIPLAEVERYAGRKVVMKRTPEGELIEAGFIGGGPGRLGGKIGAEKTRRFPTAEAAQAEGFVVMPYEEAVFTKARAAMNRVADKQTADWLTRNLPDNVGVRSTETPLFAVQAAEQATKRVQSLGQARNVARRALRGERLPGATIASIRRNTPDLGEQLDRALAISVPELERVITGMGNELFRVLRTTPQGFREALEQARLARGVRGMNPNLGARNITAGELTEAIGTLARDERTAQRMLSDIYRNAFRIPNEERKFALQQIVDSADKALPEARFKAKDAVAKRGRAGERAQTPGFDEARVEGPAFQGKIFTGPGANEFRNELTQLMARPEVNSALKAIEKVNAVQRIFALAGDASLFGIQLIADTFRHPFVFGRSVGTFATQFTRSLFNASAARQFRASMIQQNADMLHRMPGIIVGGTTEFTQALGRGGLLSSDNLFGKIAGAPLRPFQQAFETTMDAAGIHLGNAMEHLAAGDPQRLRVVEDYINNMRGLTSSARLGVSPNQQLVESALLLAPRYRRAVAALHASVLQGGLRGELARKAYLSLITGVATTYAGLTIALGVRQGKSPEQIKEELRQGLDPSSSRFLLWRMGGQLVGPGSKFTSDARLVGKLITRPTDFTDFSEWNDNPGLQWVRSQLAAVPSTAWDLISGERYLGDPFVIDPLNRPKETMKTIGREFGENLLPIWLQSALFEGGTPRERAIRGAADFGGARSFPQGGVDILRDQSFGLLGKSYDDAEPTERELLREILRGQLLPLQQQSAERGQELSRFFVQLDEIEQQRQRQLVEVAEEVRSGRIEAFAMWNEYRTIQAFARGRRFEAGVEQEFESADVNDPDPNRRALAQRNALLGDPRVQTTAGRIDWDKYDVELVKLEKNWPPEVRAYILRNTTRRPIPRRIFKEFAADAQREIMASVNARKALYIGQGRPDLAELSEKLFFLEGVQTQQQSTLPQPTFGENRPGETLVERNRRIQLEIRNRNR